MPAKIANWAVTAAGVALVAGSGDALAPQVSAAQLSCSPYEPLAAAPLEEAAPPDAAQRALVEHLSRRFYIAAEPTERMVQVAHRAARDVGLQFYNGAFWDATAQYAQKVLTERERLARVVRPRGGV